MCTGAGRADASSAMPGTCDYVYLIDETNVGPVAMFCAPKTGCTSLTKIAKRYSISHVDLNHWHGCSDDCIEGRIVVLTVRDPRTRLLSLWRHFCREKRTQITLGVFIDRQEHLMPFFKCTLSDWYKPVLDHSPHLIRIETFHDDLKGLFGWTRRIHVNITDSRRWRNHHNLDETQKWWIDDAKRFGYMA